MIEVQTLRSLFTVPMSLCCDPRETGIVNELGFDSDCKKGTSDMSFFTVFVSVTALY